MGKVNLTKAVVVANELHEDADILLHELCATHLNVVKDIVNFNLKDRLNLCLITNEIKSVVKCLEHIYEHIADIRSFVNNNTPEDSC